CARTWGMWGYFDFW
nr:immunoglobulin heavy chain junction region [Macaca mulatta]MOX14509.1 immunoglobulin heavy chain junction region [Macaca mulatta]MOX14537.1 immunoglobulin heavy chain junction region [Macaca mulatta]MOX14644.1 immunoglobulin heavy chain junction region [Macaca mulatta]MOX14672.1 immunoglobulin heavy chain junction region [Macaca mulatta]